MMLGIAKAVDGVARRRAFALAACLGFGFSGCASEEVATSPYGMMPPAMAGVKDPSSRMASASSSDPAMGRPIASAGSPALTR